MLEDVPALERLIPESVRALQVGEYTREQMEGALGTVFGVDRQLIRDGTYFVMEDREAIVACGGWSKRRTPFGSDHAPAKDDTELDPLREAAKIRAFFRASLMGASRPRHQAAGGLRSGRQGARLHTPGIDGHADRRASLRALWFSGGRTFRSAAGERGRTASGKDV